MSDVLEWSGSGNSGLGIANDACKVGSSERADVRASTEIVPEALLEPLGPVDSRGLLRQESAIILDRYLRKLAVQDAHCRLALGRLSAPFLDTRAHQELGFARLGDYTGERLGVGVCLHRLSRAGLSRFLAAGRCGR